MSSLIPMAEQLNDLHLRPLTASDQKFVCDIYQDCEMMQMIGSALNPSQALSLFNLALKDIETNKAWYFIVENRTTNHDMAFIGMQSLLTEPKCLEVGSMVLKPYRNRGIAAWVQQQAFEKGSKEYGISGYVVYCAANHHAANNCYLRMGFKLITNISTNKHHMNLNCWHFELSELT